MRDLAEHYKILEIEYGASLEDIKQAHKDLVMVWHPDRFSGNPRLQQKAQEKLKLVNAAYEKLKTYHHNSQNSTPKSPQEHGSQSYPSSQKRQTAPEEFQFHSKSVARQHDPIISLQEAKSILSKYKFKLVTTVPGCYSHYVSGPFDLDVREDVPEVILSVPCNSVNTFHRVLLSIPCKSAGMFCQSDAEELIHLLKSNLE